MRRLSLYVLFILSLFGATGCPQGVEEGLPPVVTLPDGNVQLVEVGESITLSPVFDNLTPQAQIRWLRNGQVVGSGMNFTFQGEVVGVFYLTVEVATEFGKDAKEIRINVWKEEEPPTPPTPPTPPDTVPSPSLETAYLFEQMQYNIAEGRSIRLLPLDIDSTRSFCFEWFLDGASVQKGDDPLYRFEATVQGPHTVILEGTTSDGGLRRDTLSVQVCPPEGTFRRPVTATSSPYADKVLLFLPAAGQYVNENYTATTMEEACAYAMDRLKEEKYVSLGGFGGTLVLGFDHSVANDGDYNFAVKNTIYSNYSEPGIVWVSQDENGDGLPNDTWYELKGAEYGMDCTLQDYAVTYYRPEAPGQPVVWTDNRGGSGSIDYLVAYHKQDYYYPLWVEADRYTLRGTRLEARNYDQSGRGTYWINPDYEWGYADNYSETDMLPEVATGITKGCNHFKISNAVTYDGQPANLQYIDFVKVQTGLNAKSGWLGELSTEVCAVIDYTLVK
jgi:hypothetical protein